MAAALMRVDGAIAFVRAGHANCASTRLAIETTLTV
jgi:hypothetical protein